MTSEHLPVMYAEVIAALTASACPRLIDGTLGAGGHAQGLLEKTGPDSQLLGLDADPAALQVARARLERFGNRVRLVHANFQRLAEIARQNDFVPADAILLDLGISSIQLADAERGFSFTSIGALDMRFDPNLEKSAADLVNELSERELANLIFQYGEDRAARRLARAIVRARPIETANELADVIVKAVGRHGRIHPATRTFLALRIAVNHELEVLEEVLPQTVEITRLGARIAILSFHSLEDRLVKNFFRGEPRLRVLTKKPLKPGDEELAMNPRARSAKLRVAERV